MYRISLRSVTLLCLATLAGCAGPKNNTYSPPFSVTTPAAETVWFQGSISHNAVQSLQGLLETSDNQPKTLIISSPGGEVLSGIEMGRLVREYQLQVVVRGICASSCANYIVPASHKTFIEKDAILGWHGGALQSMYVPFGMSFTDRLRQQFSPQARQQHDQFLARWQAEEQRFFADIGVNQAITILGMMSTLDERDAALFSYDLTTLAKLGLTNIEFENQQATHNSTGDRVVQIFTLTPEKLATLLARHEQALRAR